MSVTPIQQPPIEDLRNALQALVAWREESLRGDLEDVERLLAHAIEGLSEPNAAAIHVATAMLRAAMGPTAFELADPRLARDTASVILNAQLTGFSPETL